MAEFSDSLSSYAAAAFFSFSDGIFFLLLLAAVFVSDRLLIH